jgi:hypothetical protein
MVFNSANAVGLLPFYKSPQIALCPPPSSPVKYHFTPRMYFSSEEVMPPFGTNMSLIRSHSYSVDEMPSSQGCCNSTTRQTTDLHSPTRQMISHEEDFFGCQSSRQNLKRKVKDNFDSNLFISQNNTKRKNMSWFSLFFEVKRNNHTKIPQNQLFMKKICKNDFFFSFYFSFSIFFIIFCKFFNKKYFKNLYLKYRQIMWFKRKIL